MSDCGLRNAGKDFGFGISDCELKKKKTGDRSRESRGAGERRSGSVERRAKERIEQRGRGVGDKNGRLEG